MQDHSHKGRVCAALGALTLSACAQYTWVGGGGPNAFPADKYQCMRESAAYYPNAPAAVQLVAAQQGPSTTNCNAVYNQVNCTTIPGHYTPPATMMVDQNANAREAGFNACMNAKGYSLQRVK